MLSKVTIAARNKHSLLSETLSQKEMLKCNDGIDRAFSREQSLRQGLRIRERRQILLFALGLTLVVGSKLQKRSSFFQDSRASLLFALESEPLGERPPDTNDRDLIDTPGRDM
jgi:hypothetical protein